ncbi:ubc11 protein [Saitozyma podzolica]|uniref:Ubc11 protein n=1 Tax=Saitozyma podzolica TaxID=1890683 RepID=A0A427YNA2_9TREE|nr:ubc11 protein [Saitozyma podzolica]
MATSSVSTASTSSPKPKASGSSEAGGFAVTKRLRKELMTLMMTPTPGVSAFPESDSNLFKWAGTLTGPDGTVYEGLTYRLNLTFPPEYPYRPPTIKFDTPCYHPNVAMKGGTYVLTDKWSAVYSVHTVLVSLQSLLGDPNNASPLNVEAAELWADQEAFKEKVVASYKPL